MTQLAPEERKTEFIGTHVDTLTRAELLALARREDRSLSWILRRALQRELGQANTDEETTT